MSRPERVSVVALLFALTTWGPGCGGPSAPSPAGCTSDNQCQPDARCLSQSCVVNRAPIADFTVSGALEVGSLVTLDGSASRDPDPGDAVTSHLWSIDADSASCQAPAVAGTGRTAQVRFGCAGRFLVRLTVLDGKHAESVASTRTLDVQARSGTGMVEAGPDQSVDHACSGTPVTCRLPTPVQLTATIAGEATATVRWSAQPPPGRELDEHRRVRFVPSANAVSPTVQIETDGTAISGDWLFRVEVLDGAGVLDADVTRLSVGNRAPVIQGGPATSYDHVYSAAAQIFTAGDTFPVAVVDPDGDPVIRQVEFHHAGDGGAPFLGEDLGDAIRFSVMVPRSAPEDALLLVGAEGLERSAAFTATDVNGESADATFPIRIGNRPPTRIRGSDMAAEHSYEAGSFRYLSQPALGQWVDPDGDPLDYAVAADGECPAYGVDADGTVRVQCSREFTSQTSLQIFMRERTAVVAIQDPWAQATAQVTFRIGNRAPSFVEQPVFKLALGCAYRMGELYQCRGSGSAPDPANVFKSRSYSLPSGVADPDGDPLVLTRSNATLATCNGGSQPCSLPVTIGGYQSCSIEPYDETVSFVATDGVTSVTGSIRIDAMCDRY